MGASQSRGSARLVILSAAKDPRPSFDHTIQIELQTVIVRSLTPTEFGVRDDSVVRGVRFRIPGRVFPDRLRQVK